MAQYIRMEENEDGTITTTMKVNDIPEEISVVVAMSFDDLITAFRPSVKEEEIDLIEKNSVFIPNDIQGS